MTEILLAVALAVVGFVAAGIAWNQGSGTAPVVVAGVVFVVLHFWPPLWPGTGTIRRRGGFSR